MDRERWPGGLRTLVFPLSAFAAWRFSSLLLIAATGGAALGATVQWDGNWYQRILREGYTPWEQAGVGQATMFFPLVSWLTAAVKLVVGSEPAAILITCNVLAVLAIVAVHRALGAWRGESVARGAVIVMLLFPSSLFLWSFYSEAAFVALSAAAFVAQERDRPWLAALAAAGVSAARVPGALIVPALMVAHVARRRRLEPGVLVYLTGLAGLGAVMTAQWWQAGSPLAFLATAKVWERSLGVPFAGVVESIGVVIGRGLADPALLALSDIGATVFGLVGLVLLLARRWPVGAIAWAALMLAAPLSSGPSTGIARYLLAAWPVFGAVAEAGRGLPRPVRVAYLAASAAVLAAFLYYWGHGRYLA